MESDRPSCVPSCRDRYVDRPRSGLGEAPEPRRGEVAHNRIATARKGRSMTGPVLRDSSVPDRVNAAMQTMQSSRAQCPSDRTRRIAQATQLSAGHDAMLCLRQLRNGVVRTHFLPHTGNRCVRVGFLPSARSPIQTNTACERISCRIAAISAFGRCVRALRSGVEPRLRAARGTSVRLRRIGRSAGV
jgi:hypothetical protein